MQTRDWKRCHIDECTMLKAVRKSCPNQDSSFARLFVRTSLKTNVSVWFNYLTITTVNEFQKLFQELSPLCRMTWRHLVCHRFPASCQSWPQSSAGRPPSSWSTSHKIVVNCSKRGSLSSTLWINITITTYGHSAAPCTLWVSWSGYPCRCLTRAFNAFHHSKAPIAYCSFLNKTMYNPVCNPNAVFVPVIDAVHGPVVRVQALRLLKEGERVSKILPY